MKKINLFIFILGVLIVFISILLILMLGNVPHNTTIPIGATASVINDASSISNQNIEQRNEFQRVVFGTVLSVSNSQFVMISNNRTITVAMNPNELMYLHDSRRGSSRISQSFIKPGHQIRIVTNDQLDSSVIKPLVIEYYSL